MHIFFSGIGGTGIGPLALIAKQAGYDVSGSDMRDSQYIHYLMSQGLADITIGQSTDDIRKAHQQKPIDWFVYSSAVKDDNAELVFCRKNNIKASKRDELLNKILTDKKLKMIAIAGTHGKTTTTSMVIWLFKKLGIPVSYSVGAKISFGDMGHYEPGSEYFVYECDEYDRNFLAFRPYLSIITGIAWDHHEIFLTEQDYNQAFKQFTNQSDNVISFYEDWCTLELGYDEKFSVVATNDTEVVDIKLVGKVNRLDAWLAVNALAQLTMQPEDKLLKIINDFPGLSRRFEKIAGNLYTDYAHTTEKIAGAINTAVEQAAHKGQKVVVVYEPLTNRRMHHTKQLHKGLFKGVSSLYWVPSYLAREDPAQAVLSPTELIKELSQDEQESAAPMELDSKLKEVISRHLASGDLVLCLSGGGGNSLDEWLRKEFAS